MMSEWCQTKTKLKHSEHWRWYQSSKDPLSNTLAYEGQDNRLISQNPSLLKWGHYTRQHSELNHFIQLRSQKGSPRALAWKSYLRCHFRDMNMNFHIENLMTLTFEYNPIDVSIFLLEKLQLTTFKWFLNSFSLRN